MASVRAIWRALRASRRTDTDSASRRSAITTRNGVSAIAILSSPFIRASIVVSSLSVRSRIETPTTVRRESRGNDQGERLRFERMQVGAAARAGQKAGVLGAIARAE